MSKFLARVLIGAGAAAVGFAVAGPFGAYGGWKLGGFAATGNPLHLIPGGGLLGDASAVVADFASTASDAATSITDVTSLHADVGLADGIDVHGGDSTNTVWGTPPADIHGGDPRNNILGVPPSDVFNHPT